jgi:holo-[acyl-carrier protein] synthase
MKRTRGLSVGVDLVDVRQVEAALAAFGDRYVSRLFTSAEAAYARQASAETARRLGARFAAKEAVIKALRGGEMGISPKAIEVVRAVDGSCELELSGSALAAARSLGIDSLALSMSHEGDTAVAMVVAERTGPNPRAPQSKTSKRSPSRAGRRR